MEASRRDFIVARLLSNYTLIDYSNDIYRLEEPNPMVKYQSQILYNDIIRENRFNKWITEDKALHMLIRDGFCTPDIDNNLKEIETRIEDLKIDLYDSLFTPDRNRQIAQTLEKVKQKKDEMVATRHMFDHLTLKGFAEMCRRQFIIYATLFYEETEERVWLSPDDINSIMLEVILGKYTCSVASIDELREIARTEPWRSYWNIKKVDVFNIEPARLTEEQRTLILFSKMYDSVYEHPNCPPEDVLENDDMLDGWLLKEKRLRQKDKMTQQLDRKLGKKAKAAGEVFLPAKSKEDANRINAMNDMRAQIIKKQREGTIKKLGKVTDDQFQDKKIELQMQANQQFVKTVKGR